MPNSAQDSLPNNSQSDRFLSCELLSLRIICHRGLPSIWHQLRLGRRSEIVRIDFCDLLDVTQRTCNVTDIALRELLRNTNAINPSFADV
jgi:hypothetical protein